ncbi:unnamed protein product, partial [Caenorhabditis auriculariae]
MTRNRSETVLNYRLFGEMDMKNESRTSVHQNRLIFGSANENMKMYLLSVVRKLFNTKKMTTSDIRRQKIKKMMLHAWNGYKNYSWGFAEVSPVSKTPHWAELFGGDKMPVTIVDALDTLFIMDLQEEYEEARDFVRDNFTMESATTPLSVFETTIRFVGGLLSAHALTKEQFYVDKAKEVADSLLPAFDQVSGIPTSILDVSRKIATNFGWAGGSILAEIGTLHLEFVYLSQLTGNSTYRDAVQKIRDALDRMPKKNGLYPTYINTLDVNIPLRSIYTLSACGDSFYEYLLKSWLQSDRTDEQAQRMYWNASQAIVSTLLKKSSKSNLTYLAVLNGEYTQHRMGQLACFAVGMFGLQAVNELNQDRKDEAMKIAEDLAKTCHESFIRSETGIGPEEFDFEWERDATAANSVHYLLRPEPIEGFFYLWRLTGKP